MPECSKTRSGVIGAVNGIHFFNKPASEREDCKASCRAKPTAIPKQIAGSPVAKIRNIS